MSTVIHTIRRRRAAGARTLGVVLAILLVSMLVIQRSQSAFSSSTENSGNQLGAGAIHLTDDDADSALFDVPTMNVGQTETKCIVVTYQGDLGASAPVRMYGGYADSADAGTTVETGLGDYLDLSVQVGTAGSTCASFTPETTFGGTDLNTWISASSDYASGASTGWQPTAGAAQNRAIKISLTLQDDNLAQGLTVEPKFTWEVKA